MDLMSFPLLGFMLAATQGCQFYTVIKTDSDFKYMDFFDHILRINSIPQGKMIVVGKSTKRSLSSVVSLITRKRFQKTKWAIILQCVAFTSI